jgi:SAM-dependent methyltransferase
MSAPVCRSCGSTRVSLRGRKSGEFLRREFEFYACAECGFMMVEPFSGFEIYNDAYYRGAGPDPYVDYEAEYHNWQHSDRMLEFDDLASIAEGFLSRKPNASPSPSTLQWLDFGCGAGGFLKYLRARGSLADRRLELAGHDVGSYADMLKTTDGFRIHDLDELSRTPAERYDVISMIEVIEHLPAPLEPMRLVSRLLKPGGLLLLTTGNLASQIARRQGIHYRYCAPEIHVSLFTPSSLTKLYRRVGLEPHAVRFDGAVRFKVLKSLRHRRALRAIAAGALSFPPFVRAVDALYGVSDMPCAVKPDTARNGASTPQQ